MKVSVLRRTYLTGRVQYYLRDDVRNIRVVHIVGPDREKTAHEVEEAINLHQKLKDSGLLERIKYIVDKPIKRR